MPAIERLLDRADVLVENFRPGTMDRLGLGWDRLSPRWPRLVYCSISGFGQTGPRRDQPGYDAVVQAEAGLMSITGDADGPPYRLGVAIADIVSGMFAAQGIAMALLARARTGRGQQVDVGMLDAAVALLTYQAGIHLASGAVPQRMGNRHPTIVPYETFAASDGEFVLVVGNDELWRGFCRVIGRDDLAADPRFATNRARVEEAAALRPMLAATLAARPRGEWIPALRSAGIPCGEVRDLGDVFADPQIEARSMVVEVQHAVEGAVRVLGVPIKLSGTPGAIRRSPPALGEHTASILGELGLSAMEIAALDPQ
jgi:crotonobetainyl-CoA:carnitine CoA-transferase CaiB-like acyl-CoA transferase